MNRSGLFDDGGHAVPLLGVDVRAEVLAGHASAVVKQRYRNDEKKAIEAIYTFPLPSKAILTGFSMTVAGRRIEGEVKEREEAFRAYDDAITAGHGAALLEQERPNVFTANVGNLLPGEETIIEVHYVEPVLADEGAVRWSIPTLVAPRYIPRGLGTPNPSAVSTALGTPNPSAVLTALGTPERTAHGTADPTAAVPDADRISPPIGSASYGLTLDLRFDLGVPVDIESPSHAIVVDGSRVTFSQREVPLDRDVIITAVARENAILAGAVTHRKSGAPGVLGLTLVPDLGVGNAKRRGPEQVVFLLDRSGSMGGASMPEARTALRLCLRQLREGDLFSILAFDDAIERFASQPVPFTQTTLQRADAWLESIDARGGTELLQPMMEAAKLAPDGVMVLITDGEVGNEDQIFTAYMGARKTARVYSFGIGTNVSDALLHSLADATGGAIERIHPGERVDEKVVAQFARATAPRVTELTIKTRGIELGEMAPAEPKALVDGEPFSLFATYEQAGRGAIELRGKLDGEAFYLEVPVELADESDRPVVPKLWAQARIRELERAALTGRRAEAMKERIVKLAIAYGVSSKYTSFVVVEKRTGDRRASGQPETRVVPVNAPAGWAMFQSRPTARSRSASVHYARGGPLPAPRAAMRVAMAAMPPARAMSAAPPSSMPSAPTASAGPMPRSSGFGSAPTASSPITFRETAPQDPVVAILYRQAASGLWEAPGRDPIAVTVDALLELVRLGITTAHPTHGAQLKKALDALLARLPTTTDPAVRDVALGVAWLAASGRRTRRAIEDAARVNPALAALLTAGEESAVRARFVP